MRHVKQAVKLLNNWLQRQYALRNGAPLAPIFIIGSGRSGNTLLRRVLLNHPDIYIPPETYVLGPSISAFQEHSHLEWNVICRIVLAQFAFSEDFETFPTPYLRPLYRELLKTPPQQRSYDHIINKFYLSMAARAKPEATIWGDKTPLNVFYLDAIHSAFPGGRFVHIVRDGYDVVASYLKMGRYSRIADASKRWLISVELCQNFGRLHPEKYFELYYEDLVRNPAETVKKLCDFLSIDYSPVLIGPPVDADALGDLYKRDHYQQVAQSISADSIGKGRKSLSGEDYRQVRELISQKASKLGYN